MTPSGPAPGGLQRPHAPSLVLASGSATRLALLQAAGLAVEAVAPSVDEAAVKAAAQAAGQPAEATALTLADLKASQVAALRPAALVIGADQLLVCGERWFDKPPDLAAARAQLLALCGRRHALVTAIVCRRGEQVVWRHVATPRLTMRPFSAAFLDAYLQMEGAALLTSVGAYRIEAAGLHLFETVEGEQAAIAGLPMLALLGWLRQANILVT